MEMDLLRFKHCDSNFYPYLEKVINRLPQNVQDKVLNDTSFQIIAGEYFSTAHGLYFDFDPAPNSMLYLNYSLLRGPQIEIIYTIAHEIAHLIAGKGRSGLWEKEAEELLSEWGFSGEVEIVQYSKPIAENAGYKAGIKWAQGERYDDLYNRFGEYLEEWDEDRLSGERLEMLFYDVDPMSILGFKEVEDKVTDEKVFVDSMSLDKGVVWGIMGNLKMRMLDKERNINKEEDKLELLDTLQRISNELSKFFMLGAFDPQLDPEYKISMLSIEIENLLEKIKNK